MVKNLRKRMFSILVTLAMLISLMPAVTLPARAAGTTLAAGDIAFIGIYTDGSGGVGDAFSFITLKALSAGTVIYFTDNGWVGGTTKWVGGTEEVHWAWTVPDVGSPIGTIVNVSWTAGTTPTVSSGTASSFLYGTSWHYATGGDNLMAYQISGIWSERPSTPTFIAAMDFDRTTTMDDSTGWSTGTPSSGYEETFCALPSGLTNGTNCVALFNDTQSYEYDNVRYSGTLTGTASAIRAAINNYANWTGSDATPFDITSAAFPAPSITAEVAPTVTTQAVSSITSTTATGNGNITALGTSNPTQYGVCWSTSANPTTANSKTEKGASDATGAFTSGITGLTAGTTYHVRAYATNAVGTSYGGDVTFTTSAVAPTATTEAASSVTATGATLNGTVNANNSSTTVTFDYGLTTGYGSSATATQSPVTGTSASSVSATITGLTPNTTYHYRVTGVNSAGTTNGSDMTFTTSALAPTVTTASVTTYGSTTATLGGEVTASGGETVTDRGVVYSTTDETPTIDEGATQVSIGTGTGSFSQSVTGLSPNTTYYVNAYATNSVGTSYGTATSFTTAAITATISPATALTEENLNTNSLTVTLSGTTFKDSTLSASNFTLNNAPGGVSIAGVTHNNTTGCTITLAYSGTDFDTNVTDFSITIAAAELNYSSDLTSNTLTITAKVETAPTLTTTGVSTYGSTTATLGGSVSADGGETVTERGVVYSTSNTNLTIGESGVMQGTSGTGTGAFNVLVSSLSPSTTYYVRAYATNSVGTSYGGAESFTTSPISASASPALALTEENLDTNSLTVTLSGTTFANTTPVSSNFTLNNAPTGVTVESVTYTDTTHCTVNLAYNGTDFDSNVTTFSVTIASSELASGSALTSGTLTITATVEVAPTATITVANTALKAGETSLATITFSAPASGFTNDDFITIENGILSTVSSSDGGITWTATLTPTANITDASNIITLDNTGIADAEGNSGTGTTVSNNYAIDTLRPTATIVVADTALKTGDTSLVTITFSEAVTGVTKDKLTVENGSLDSVSSSDGGITWTATFTPTGNIADTSNVITLINEGVSDAAGNTVTGPTSSGNYAIDTLRPTATIVLADTALKAGETSTVSITFSEAVTGFTAADITAANGALSGLSSSDGGITWTVTFTPTAGITDASNVITLANTGLADAAGNAGTGTTNSDNYTVDTVIPTVSGVSTLSNVTYVTGQNMDYTVSFSEAVTVNTTGGTPYLTLTIGAVAVNAAYESGSGTTSLVFRYTVVSNDADANGVALSSNVTLNGGAIKDAAGNDAALTFTGSTAAGVLVDAVAPTISSVTGPVAGTYTAGDNLTFTATFDENVTVTGSPYIALTVGTATVNAAYVSGTGTTSLAFRYTVVSGNLDADGIVCAAEITLPAGAAIRDAAGNEAALTYTVPTTSSVLVDAVAPTISSAAIVSGNSYIDLVFSEGIYGASGGATALTAAKLALTFTQNSGSATNVTISSIKKNDNTAEASASALTGGETTIRVFLSVTGTPSGAETIEIKPTDATSIYDFIGNSMASTETTGTKTLNAPVSYGGDTGSTTNNGTAVVEVNGEKQDAGQTSTQTTGGTTTTTITVDDTKLNNILEQKGNNATVTLPASGTPNVVVGQLTGQTVKNMETKEAVLEIKTETVTYTLPASQINIDAVSSQLGSQVELKDIKVSVRIAEPAADTVRIVEDTANRGGYQLVVKPVEFKITCTNGDQTVEVSRFNGYVERTIAIPDGVDPSKITTGIVLNADGTFSHVPTQIIVIDGKYYAKINSLTNSTYSVVYNPVIFTDMANHWAKDAVNDMGSRMVVTGIGNGIYEPSRSITRAEFAAIIVRALGLQKGSRESAFGDVTVTDWFNGYVDTATSYSLITGYDSASFAPNDTITREQAMTILARAMKLTGLSVSLTDSEVSTLLAGYTDGASVSSYAKAGVAACIKTGVVTGTTASTLSPKDSVTRAEVAAMVQSLLKKSGLI